MSIKLTKLYKHYGTNVVVNNVSAEIQDGELFVLLGASGSGKSTILRIITGLTFPDSGSVEVSGKDITYLRPQDRGIGFVFQNYSLFQHLNVYKNVEFGLRIKKISKKECRIRSEELLDIVGLTGFGNRYPKQLSGGQQQRVAVARALASKPAVLLLDEPFGALDVKIRARMRTRLKEIQHRLNVTMILVTHDQEEAFELADRIGIVDRGRLLEVGTPETLYHYPRNAFVATFVGGGNVLIGKTVDGQIQLGKRSFPFPSDTPYHVEGVPVRILFRPETVIVSNKSFKSSDNLHVIGRGKITDMLFSGSQTKMMVETDELIGVRSLAPQPAFDQVHTKIEIIKPGIRQEEGLKIGQEVWLGIKEFHVLDPGGIRLLIIIDDLQLGEILLDFARRIVQKAMIPATIFGIVDNPKKINQFHEQLTSVTEKYFPGKLHDKVHLTVGTDYYDVLIEAKTGNYDLVLAKIPDYPKKLSKDFESMISKIIDDVRLPTLIVQTPADKLETILICTAGGEPGKSDVRFTGRLARRLKASTRVLHIARPGLSTAAKNRINTHLKNSQVLIENLGVKCTIDIKEGDAVEAINNTIASNKCDLVVVGAPIQDRPFSLKHQDFIGSILNKISSPILVVPMEE